MRVCVCLLLLASACAGPQQAELGETDAPHLGDAWFSYRASALSITSTQARARDAALDEDAPPEDFWDAPMQTESAALWRTLCAQCHGLAGDLEGAPELPEPKPRSWGGFGVRMGFFFGGDGMRAGIYRKIRDGGAPSEDGKPLLMPAWGEKLSREQIWGLVSHIEGF